LEISIIIFLNTERQLILGDVMGRCGSKKRKKRKKK